MLVRLLVTCYVRRSQHLCKNMFAGSTLNYRASAALATSDVGYGVYDEVFCWADWEAVIFQVRCASPILFCPATHIVILRLYLQLQLQLIGLIQCMVICMATTFAFNKGRSTLRMYVIRVGVTILIV